MGRFVPLAVGALGALQVLGAVAQGIPACINPCSDQLRTEFAKFSCGSATDAACLCPKADFSFGIRDCAKRCGANDENVRQFLAASGAFCTGLLPPAPAATNAQATTTTGTAQATTTSGSSATTQGALAPTSTSSTSASVTGHTSTGSAHPTSSASTSPASSTSRSSTSSTSDTPAGPTSSAAAASDPSGSGLSKSSVAGICVGIAAGVMILAAIVVVFLFRNRKRKPRQSMEISKPLPGSGRTYGGRDRGSFEKYGNDIEMTSNRYEDMVPRQQPRTMV